MSNTIFRQKSLDRISSPEQLNDYIRVSTPSVWMLLIAIVVLLAGVCVWGIFGRMDTVLPALAIAQENSVVAYVREEDAAAIKEGMTVSIGDSTGTVSSVSDWPVTLPATFTEYMRHAVSLQEGEWVYSITLDVDCADGVYTAQIVTDSVSPMSFVLN